MINIKDATVTFILEKIIRRSIKKKFDISPIIRLRNVHVNGLTETGAIAYAVEVDGAIKREELTTLISKILKEEE